MYSPPPDDKPDLPDIVPMRRGRPAASPGPQKQDASARKVADGDPFAALDSKSAQKLAEADEISSRFPTLDQFALLHDKGSKFDFDSSATSPRTKSVSANQHIAERLADEAFTSSHMAQGQVKKLTTSTRPQSVTPTVQQMQQAPSPPIERLLAKVPSATSQAGHVQPSRAPPITRGDLDLKATSSQTGSRYVSTGTMTSDFSSRASTPQADSGHGQTLPERHSSKANLDVLPIHARPPHLRRPSLSSRPSLKDIRQRAQASDPAWLSTTSNVRPRPASTSFESSTVDFLREKELEKSQKSSAQPVPHSSNLPEKTSSLLRTTSGFQPRHTKDDLLLDMEDSKPVNNEKQLDVSKRATVSAAPAPRKPANKLGDSFHRLEGGPNVDTAAQPGVQDAVSDQSSNALIDVDDDDDDDDMAPEMRREVERQKLEEEEKRVAAAQAEYRNRVVSSGNRPMAGPKSVGGPRTASTIQSRMQSLLKEDQKAPTVQRTAQGYGKYTDDPASTPSPNTAAPGVPRKSVGTRPSPVAGSNGTRPEKSAPTSTAKMAGSKPPAPKKKPAHLNSFPTGGARPPSPMKQQSQTAQSERLVAVGLPGQPTIEMSAQDKADYIEDFTKRFPSLSAIETEAQRGRRVSGSRH